ncbi:hypothetical protein [Halogranum rubrum]|uniref:Fenitrothion hydrolase n=1 Tax=Halogranum salarium B-1 TaxID=1210908 RepID=J2ZVE4_9EURY|nr:hypothetical protein [Halogranum salarium]EJN57003.1 hypothetical protein HSB1_48200 [Halogranum salarium B-1]
MGIRRLVRTVVGSTLLLVCVGVTSAHEVGGSRFDAPIPLPVLFAGAGLTVAVTAGWLAMSERPAVTRTWQWQLLGVSPAVVTSLRTVFRGGFFLAFLLSLWLGLVGPQIPAENFTTVFVWPLWLKGIGLFAAVFGSPWRPLSPWRTLYTWLTRLEGEPIAVAGSYPGWLSEWPAVAGFLFWIGIVENLTVIPRSPQMTTILVAGYALLMLVGAVAFGDEWFEHADALAVLYRLFGRVAPVRLNELEIGEYGLSIRSPWQACSKPARDGALVVFIIAAVYTVSFDGFTSTPEYQTLLFGLRNLTNMGPRVSIGLYLVGLVLFVGVFVLVASVSELVTEKTTWKGAARAFAPSVLPIAVAYEIAHNYSFVSRNLGQLVTVLGKYVVTTPPTISPLGWLSVPTFWGSQVILIIGGHVIAVVASHYATLDRYPTTRQATYAHIPLTVLMIGYTVLSLWIISRPVVS